MKISVTDYQDRMVALWRKNPWCVVRSVVGEKVTGMSIMYPATFEYYHHTAERGVHEL